jgi:tRNA A37 threonylcarbamoyladenosine synthetase subunit TsaC/SUA5/YrdC
MSKSESWSGSANETGVAILSADGGAIVSPTKVGYIIMTSDREGLNRKFNAKQRNLNKPGVVLCSSMEQLKELAELNPEIEAFYQAHWDKDILLGCILPWKKGAMKYIPDDGCKELMMDKRDTSCFVIKFGTPSEQIVKELWDTKQKLIFASSANPSGKGNRGLITGIGERIESAVDLKIEANDYVASIQPDSNAKTRHEQGVMVSMVDATGTLVAMQEGKREITPCPTIIRKGLDNEKIMELLAEHFNTWDFRQGTYY